MSEVVRVLGFGSPQGDDRAGWRVIAGLRQSPIERVEAHALAQPMTLLDYLENCRALILVDASVCGRAAGSHARWNWPDPKIGASPTNSTHGLGLAQALELAQAIDRLPRSVTLWTIEIAPPPPGEPPRPSTSPLSASALSAVAAVEREIRKQIADDFR